MEMLAFGPLLGTSEGVLRVAYCVLNRTLGVR